MKQTVLGCGRWGSFHLWYGAGLGHTMTGWEPAGSEPFRDLVHYRRNAFLSIPESVLLTTSLADAIRGAQQIVVSCPAQTFRSLARTLAGHDLSAADLVLCMKGLESGTGKRLSAVAFEEGVNPLSMSTWVGPGHPQEFVKGVPGCMIVASENEAAAVRVSAAASSPLIRIYQSRDLTGCEIGAAAKNVIGIAAGMLDGKGMTGLKGALMARGPQEVARLVSAAGGDWRSVYGLSHLGDYEATLFSPWSRNRAWGEAFVRGGRVTGLAEGVPTSEALLMLARDLGVELPITGMVAGMISGLISFEDAVETLFGRPMKEEFPDILH